MKTVQGGHPKAVVIVSTKYGERKFKRGAKNTQDGLLFWLEKYNEFSSNVPKQLLRLYCSSEERLAMGILKAIPSAVSVEFYNNMDSVSSIEYVKTPTP